MRDRNETFLRLDQKRDGLENRVKRWRKEIELATKKLGRKAEETEYVKTRRRLIAAANRGITDHEVAMFGCL